MEQPKFNLKTGKTAKQAENDATIILSLIFDQTLAEGNLANTILYNKVEINAEKEEVQEKIDKYIAQYWKIEKEIKEFCKNKKGGRKNEIDSSIAGTD